MKCERKHTDYELWAFVEQYASLSGITVEELLVHDEVLHCDCGEEWCQGFRVESKALIEFWRERNPVYYKERYESNTPQVPYSEYQRTKSENSDTHSLE